MRQGNIEYRRFTQEEIEKANNVDLVSLAESYGFQTEKSGKDAIHLKQSGGLYIFPKQNCYFHHTSDDKLKEGGAIRFVMLQENLSFGAAVAKLLHEEYVTYQGTSNTYTPEPKKPLILPPKAENFKRAYWYLVSVRGIEPSVVSALMNEKKVYQEPTYGNAVFVGYDRNGIPKYCSMRSTYQNSSFKRDADTSDKSYPFFYEGKSDLVIVTEAPIDLMSHATLSLMLGKTNWRQDHRISTGCLSTAALDRYLEWHPEITKIVFAFDNDYLARNQKQEYSNWGQIAAQKAIARYTERGYQCALHTPRLNDFNTDLVAVRNGKTIAELDSMRIAEIKADMENHGSVENETEEREDDIEI